MTLRFYKNRALTEQLHSSPEGFTLQLPRAIFGGTVNSSFFIHNDAACFIENLQVIAGNSDLKFNYPATIEPNGAVEVLVTWHSTIFEALNASIAVKSTAVKYPK